MTHYVCFLSTEEQEPRIEVLTSVQMEEYRESILCTYPIDDPEGQRLLDQMMSITEENPDEDVQRFNGMLQGIARMWLSLITKQAMAR